MDPDEISKLVVDIKLSKAEEPAIVLDEHDMRTSEERIVNCLAAKVISSKSMNNDTFKSHIGWVLQATRTIKAQYMEDNIFVIEFVSALDRRKALMNGPWHFFRDLIVFKEIQGLQRTQSICFNEISIWVRCHNLPFALMQRSFLEKIENQIGSIEELDGGEHGNFLGNFMRIKVRIDILQPLKRYVRIGLGGHNEDQIIILTYERLPDFCYACDRLVHIFRECEKNPLPTGKLEFGTWLRATQSTGIRKNRPQHSTPSSSGHVHPERENADGQMTNITSPNRDEGDPDT